MNYPAAYFQTSTLYVIVIPVEPEFHNWTREKQYRTIQLFQEHAFKNGLRGFVVPVWEINGQLFSLPPAQR